MHSVKSEKPLILCVEDDKIHLSLRTAVLEQNGYSVLGVSTDIEALATLRISPILLVISDHLLGTRRGTDLAREMKKIKPLVPILLYAGGRLPEHLGSANCFLSKAEPVEMFLATVASLLNRD